MFSTMSMFMEHLKNHPVGVIFGVISGVSQTFIDYSTPYIRYIILVISGLIALTTLILKLIEIWNKVFKKEKQG